jgi:flagellar protein FliO/FliZ
MILLTSRFAPAILLLASAVSRADTSVPATSPSMGESLAQLLFGFAIVIALIFASLWLLKRLSAPRGQAAGLLKVIAATAVGPRERVVVVELGDSWLVLGVAPGQVTSLHQLPRVANVTPPPATEGDFASWLKKTLERRNAS